MDDVRQSNCISALVDVGSIGLSARTNRLHRDSAMANQNELVLRNRAATVRIKDESPVSQAIPVRNLLSTCAGKRSAVFVRDAESSEQSTTHSGEVVLSPRSEFELHRDIAKALAPVFQKDCSGCWATEACMAAKVVEKAAGHDSMLVPCGWIPKASQTSRGPSAIEQYKVVSSKSFLQEISGSVIYHQYPSLGLHDAMKS